MAVGYSKDFLYPQVFASWSWVAVEQDLFEVLGVKKFVEVDNIEEGQCMMMDVDMEELDLIGKVVDMWFVAPLLVQVCFFTVKILKLTDHVIVVCI